MRRFVLSLLTFLAISVPVSGQDKLAVSLYCQVTDGVKQTEYFCAAVMDAMKRHEQLALIPVAQPGAKLLVVVLPQWDQKRHFLGVAFIVSACLKETNYLPVYLVGAEYGFIIKKPKAIDPDKVVTGDNPLCPLVQEMLAQASDRLAQIVPVAQNICPGLRYQSAGLDSDFITMYIE